MRRWIWTSILWPGALWRRHQQEVGPSRTGDLIWTQERPDLLATCLEEIVVLQTGRKERKSKVKI
jgi:hypothetical protein